MLPLCHDNKSGNFLNKDKRRPRSIEGRAESRDLFCRFGLDDPAKFWRATSRIAKHAAVVRYHSDLDPADPRVPGDDFFRVVRLKFVQMSIVQQTIQKLAYVVRLTMIFGNNFVEFFFGSFWFNWSAGISAGASQASSLRIHRQLRNKLSYLCDGLF